MRTRISRGLSYVEDIVYIGLALLLATSAIALLATVALRFGRGLLGGSLDGNIIDLLDQVLLVLIIVEVLYTIEVSFREHVLSPEPFLIIALIAVSRRILVLTAGIAELLETGEEAFRNAMLELGVMTLLTVALVASLVMLRRRHPDAVAERAPAVERSNETS
ncbi:MAG TPA: phosphate-starvation-inducible PsiE family protein [Ardenticatenaceae bacterium]|nr:phosphate-starvation-inducible PsiE family protein [Ardenticatenaceae bacterium]